MWETWVGKTPWRRERLPTPVFWPREFWGLYSPWGGRVGHDWTTFTSHRGGKWELRGKKSACNAGDSGSILGLGRSPGEGIGYPLQYWGFPGGWDDEGSTCNAGDVDSVAGVGRSPGGGHGSPLQCLCLENPMAREAWWATVHGVARSGTQLSDRVQHSTHSTDSPGTQTDARDGLTFHTDHHNHRHKPLREMNWGLSGTRSTVRMLKVWKEPLGCSWKLHTPAPRIRISVGKHTKVWTTMEPDRVFYLDVLIFCFRLY